MRLPEGKTVVKYVIAAAVGAMFSFGYLAIQKSEFGPLTQQPLLDQLRLLCDAFTIPGMMLVLSALLVTVTNEGSLDGLRYLGHYVYHMMVPGKRSSTKRYADFLEETRGKRVKGYAFLYYVGAAYLVVGLLFYVLYKFQA